MIYMILHKMFSYDIAKHTRVADFKKSFERSVVCIYKSSKYCFGCLRC
jgi:hypothetical protein